VRLGGHRRGAAPVVLRRAVIPSSCRRTEVHPLRLPAALGVVAILDRPDSRAERSLLLLGQQREGVVQLVRIGDEVVILALARLIFNVEISARANRRVAGRISGADTDWARMRKSRSMPAELAAERARLLRCHCGALASGAASYAGVRGALSPGTHWRP
jgi:hypothetical protein